jgi:hypothetical protein
MSSGGRGDAGERFAWHGAETITGSAAAVTSEGRLIVSLRKRSVTIKLNPSVTIKLNPSVTIKLNPSVTIKLKR